MLKSDRKELDYFELVKKAKRLSPPTGRPLKVALLGDVSTQHLVPLLRVLFANNGVETEIYEAGFDTVYGARPLKRAIQAQIENPLAQQILRGDFIAGDRVVAKVKRGALVFEKDRLH